jgi:hypothetical protein
MRSHDERVTEGGRCLNRPFVYRRPAPCVLDVPGAFRAPGVEQVEMQIRVKMWLAKGHRGVVAFMK